MYTKLEKKKTLKNEANIRQLKFLGHIIMLKGVLDEKEEGEAKENNWYVNKQHAGLGCR